MPNVTAIGRCFHYCSKELVWAVGIGHDREDGKIDLKVSHPYNRLKIIFSFQNVLRAEPKEGFQGPYNNDQVHCMLRDCVGMHTRVKTRARGTSQHLQP